MNVTFVEADGSSRQLSAPIGKSLMQIAVQHSVDGIEAECGGMMTCGTCHVHLREPHLSMLSTPTADELELLEQSPAFQPSRSRLSCQIRITSELDGLVVDLPKSQW